MHQLAERFIQKCKQGDARDRKQNSRMTSLRIDAYHASFKRTQGFDIGAADLGVPCTDEDTDIARCPTGYATKDRHIVAAIHV